MKVLEEIKEKCCSNCEAECDGCWLKELISDYTKQVRTEVYDYILDRLGNIEIENNTDYNSFIAILDEVLDQIQGEC